MHFNSKQSGYALPSEKVAVQEHAYLLFNGKKTSNLDNYNGCCSTHTGIITAS